MWGKLVLLLLASGLAWALLCILRYRARLKALTDWIDSVTSTSDESWDKLEKELTTALDAASITLVPRDQAYSIRESALRFVESFGTIGFVVVSFERPPTPARRSRARRMIRLLALHAERNRALTAARQNKEEARGFEQEASAFAETSAELARRQDAILEVIPDGVAVTNDDGEIVRMNAAGREIVGVADAAPTRASLTDATDPLLQALREGTTVSGLEVAIASPAGPRIIQVKVSKLDEKGASRAAVALFRDVTRELLLEHDLRKKGHELEQNVAALERATRLKSEFLASMSHELRTPLNAVIGFTEVLLDGTYGPLNERQSQCATDVVAAGRHLLVLINDILDLSKIEAGRMELTVEDVDVAEVASQAITFVRPQAMAKGMHVENEIPRNTLFVRADVERLRQVLVNLLSNAVKFTPQSGRVNLRASNTSAQQIRISVADTGVGIAESDRSKLFREFSQIDGSVTRRFGGTGLGLAICKRLVELHGGQIDFESKVGVGSTFFFDLPAASRAGAPTFSPASTKIRRASSSRRLEPVPAHGTVLVLDEDPAAQRLVESALHAAGITAVSASNLADARRLARAAQLEMIIVDPILTDTRVDVVNRFIADRFGSFVVVSSLATQREAMVGLSAGVFIEKPIDRETLVEQIRALRERRHTPRSALIVDAVEEDARAVATILERDGFLVDIVPTVAEARTRLQREVSLLVVELELPDGDGAQLLPTSIADGPPAIVLTERELDDEQTRALEQRAGLVARKGSLSRSAFSRKVTSVCEATRRRRRRILAVDDNDQNLRLIAAVLARSGYEILEARDATSALRIARAEAPDVILMDVMLPDLDGLSATRELKADPATETIPVIAVTAQAMNGDADRARGAGCFDYVPKPIDSQRLLRAVERATGQST